MHILCTDGHIIVRHDELVRRFGQCVLLAVEGVSDGLHFETGIRGGDDGDGVAVEAFVGRIGGEGAILGIQHNDVVKVEQELAAHHDIFTRHGEHVRFAGLDVDGVAVPGQAAKTVSVSRSDVDSDLVVLSSQSDATEATVFDGFVGDVVVDGGVLEEQARHLTLVVGIKVDARTGLGIHFDEVESDGGSLPPVQFVAVTVK